MRAGTSPWGPFQWEPCRRKTRADPSALPPTQLTQGQQVALSSISYIGCSLSVVCLVLTLVTFAMLS